MWHCKWFRGSSTVLLAQVALAELEVSSLVKQLSLGFWIRDSMYHDHLDAAILRMQYLQRNCLHMNVGGIHLPHIRALRCVGISGMCIKRAEYALNRHADLYSEL